MTQQRVVRGPLFFCLAQAKHQKDLHEPAAHGTLMDTGSPSRSFVME